MSETESPSNETSAPSPRKGPNRVGETVGGKYEVLRFLGEGGMGAVYEARHGVIGRRFAIKFLHADHAYDPSVVQRFRREAAAAGRLESDNVVSVVDFGTSEGGAPYLVMEYLDGENLGEVLRRDGRFPVARAVDVMLQVCSGLEVAHSHGIIHRDLKPENLFVTRGSARNEVVKILDFGIAKLKAESAGAVSQSGAMVGTPHYMSPEQARGDRNIDERTDVFALGVIVYELLTGVRPHPGENATAVLFHLLKQAPVRISVLRPGLPAGLAEVVHRAFAFEASDRFPDVSALKAALAPFIATPSGDESPRSPEAVAVEPSVTLSQAASSLHLAARAGQDRPPDRPDTPPPRVSRRTTLVMLGLLVALGALLLVVRRMAPPPPTQSPSGTHPTEGIPAALSSPATVMAPEPSAAASDRTAERPSGQPDSGPAATTEPSVAVAPSSLPRPGAVARPSQGHPPVAPPPSLSSADRERLYEP